MVSSKSINSLNPTDFSTRRVGKRRNKMQGIEQQQNKATLANTHHANALMTQDLVQHMPNPVNVGRDIYEEGEKDDMLQQCQEEAAKKGDLSHMHSGKGKKSHTRKKSWDGKMTMIRKTTYSQRRDTTMDEGTNSVPPVDGAQSEGQGETPTQPLPAPPPLEDIPRDTAHPVPSPLPSDQDLRSTVHLLTQEVATHEQARASGHESQSPAGRGRTKGIGSSSCGNQNRIYALAGRHDQKSSPDVMTGILTIFSHDAYALIDPGSTLSNITPFVAEKFGIVPEILSDPLAVSTPVGEPIIARRVYQSCTLIVCSRQTSADLVELEMMDFDAIMGMYWLTDCYATVDCRAKAGRFHFSSEPVLEWVGNTVAPRGRYISYLKAKEVFAKWCIYHVRVRYADAEIPTLQSIFVVNEYADVFPYELPGIPPE
ncbi:uncharacterized protein [Nicotiana tomentosiformis]|uniref:uncharacterized protein n=1 Tax=Nicotiana tomentosiformis TaxID=4098 RepID=UPI00388C5A8B